MQEWEGQKLVGQLPEELVVYACLSVGYSPSPLFFESD
jgi:hypothetical protein